MKFKNWFLILMVIFLIPLGKVKALEWELPELYSKNVLIYDLTEEEMVYNKNINDRTPIASLTKILTSITAIELIDDFEDMVEITDKMVAGISNNASKAGLKTGDKVTYLDLLYGSLLPSGADATQSLAISLKGSVSNFVSEMNKMAIKIGMENSHFVNTSGLDISGQYSTASDVLKLAKYALNNVTFRKIFTTREYVMSNGLEVKSTILDYEEKTGIDTSFIKGSKTGYTDYAGLCLTSLMEYQGHEILAITINAPYVRNLYYNLQDHIVIWNYINDNYLLEEDPLIDIDINENKMENKKEVEIKINKKYQTILIVGGMVIMGVIILSLRKKYFGK